MAMAKDRSELKWVEINVDSLDEAQRMAYDEYKAIYRKMKEAREYFEAEMQSLAPDGKRLVFGYNFGKLSVAVADKVEVKAKASGPQSLGDYLKGMQANGRRC
jgi:hypothetical protein